MKASNKIFYTLALPALMTATFLTSCKPEKEPEPETIQTVSTLKIELVKNSILVGESIGLKSNLLTGTNSVLADNVTYSLSDNSIAEISSNNTITGKKTGIVELIAKRDILSDTISLNVVSAENPARDISINLSSTEIAKTGQSQVTVSVKDGNSAELGLFDTKYILSNPSIGSIDANGKFTATAAGETEISVESNGLISKKVSISVYRSGSFSGKNGYTLSGKARLVSRNGQLFVELYDGFKTSKGPDLRVFLSNASEGAAVKSGGKVLSSLKSTSGDQSYPVPLDVKITDFKFVNVHCDQYTKTFGTVELD